jgi:hypothetical protein
VMQLLGKLGGRNRRFLKEPIELEYKDNPEHGLRLILKFQTSQPDSAPTSFLVPLDRCISLATNAMTNATPEAMPSSESDHLSPNPGPLSKRNFAASATPAVISWVVACRQACVLDGSRRSATWRCCTTYIYAASHAGHAARPCIRLGACHFLWWRPRLLCCCSRGRAGRGRTRLRLPQASLDRMHAVLTAVLGRCASARCRPRCARRPGLLPRAGHALCARVLGERAQPVQPARRGGRWLALGQAGERALWGQCATLGRGPRGGSAVGREDQDAAAVRETGAPCSYQPRDLVTEVSVQDSCLSHSFPWN